MRVVSINIGEAKGIAAKAGLTGIYKEPVQVCETTALGLVGDRIMDRDHHGGPDQAVYAYTQEDYDWWSTLLDIDLAPGTFGENLTLDRWPSDIICVGDRLHIGDVVLEVTSPRIPCVTLEVRMGITGFSRAFLKAQRPGPYFRVIAPGIIQCDQSIDVVPFSGPRKRLIDWPGVFGAPLKTSSEMDEWLAVPVHHKMRSQLEDAKARYLDPKCDH